MSRNAFFHYNVWVPETLLQTKLHVPTLRPNLVPRPKLIDQLNQGLQLSHKLTLISAPAGFGKTTLVNEWVGSLRWDTEKESQIVNRIAWLSLDDGDNDLTRFLAYFVTALYQVDELEATIGKGALGMLQAPQPPPVEDVLTFLINDVAAIPDRIIFVLDDYHVIASSPIDDAITFILEHLPPQMHLVIATRDDPQLPLARLRASGQLTELRAIDLRFSSSEAAEFLNQVMGLNLSAADIAALESRTEGWIAGLQLAAIALQGTISPLGHKDASSLIKSFTGSHHFVLDYLVEEVLDQQSKSVQNFLLQTAVLNRMTGSLCDALTDQDNGQATLEMLDHANLFIIPLDEERHWYRYHHLFSDLLRQRLRQTHPDWVLPLHHKASDWYEQNGFADEAIELALRAEGFERAAHLIEEQADASWQRGEHAKLRRYLAQLPIDLVFSKPQLCIYHAWYLFLSDERDTAERSLQYAEQGLDPTTDNSSVSAGKEWDQLSALDRMKIQGRVAAVRAFMDSHQGNVPGIVHHARQALGYLPEQDATWRSITSIVLGDAHGFKGDLTAAYEARIEALLACKAACDNYYVMLASMKLAITLRDQGRLQRTVEICQGQVRLAEESGLSQSSLTGLLLVIWSEVLAEENDLDEAIRQAKKGAKLAARSVDMAMLGWVYMCLLRIEFSKGDMNRVEEIIQKVQSIARESNVPPWIMNQMAAWQVRLWLAQEKLETASQWVQERGLDNGVEPRLQSEINYFLLFDYIILARILIAQERSDKAARLLNQLLRAAEVGGRTSSVIEILMLLSLAFQAAGETDRALSALEQAFALAEPEGFIRIFVDEGQPMARLLQEALKRGIAPDYVRRLLGAILSDEPVQPGIVTSHEGHSDMVEPLSDRELEVLQLIAEGLTNQEIADRLYLSLNTVKVHNRSIYSKLDVHSRTQAVARSQELGLLPRRSD